MEVNTITNNALYYTTTQYTYSIPESQVGGNNIYNIRKMDNKNRILQSFNYYFFIIRPFD